MKLSPKTLKILIGIAAAAVIAAVLWSYRDRFDREAVVAFAEKLPPSVLVSAFALLPIAGFPITPLLVAVGLRFGFPGGMAVATGGIFFHHLVAFRLTHGLFRDRLRSRLERAGYGIPPIDPAHRLWFTALFAAVHGPPYSAKLYLLALTDIPFRIYLWIGAPIYAVFCVIPVGAGSAVGHLNPWLLYGLVALSVVLLLAGIALGKRLPSRARS